MISRTEALNLLRKYLVDEKMIKHCIAVESIMRSLARMLGEDEELWGLVGLLHDIDYDYVNRDMSRHGLEALNILKNVLPEDALQAIAGHNEHNGFVVTSEKAKKLLHALRAADHTAGLIVATALVMPGKRISEVKLNTLMRKFRSKDFARGVDRSRIMEVQQLGLGVEELLKLALESLKNVAQELEL
ncbi:HDIG domain-containing protein [Ignisphaera sp. 4213-co]|uniref:HDIG domain-containing protein n=1 Tax=Ignisphaera cupida TaxID=3050454 RepID=A0ABD4Z6H3_9CREN|nr:HD domain-containing protein [Ignisphaera sp. 4213-co]MDK6028218.1 HDIG domain-containing protein [Ignisphaera sp. 4213-co]